ncbi:hypothetical protein NHX12_015837 [Muraenolepis orangiensis]|uniref:Uncharacterized protein n=1 Tax=Muraenolepis orangiensis TaxID=630683 RepID=A0A9Q0D887_9TELE|nr:hypothetical protein NHX12_015837 [Muraenolepis orangiensis]
MCSQPGHRPQEDWKSVQCWLGSFFMEGSRERAKFKGLLSKLCSINILKSLALMADVLTELKNLSEILQNRKTTLPKAHDIMTTYVKRIESFNRYPGQHAVDASQAEEVMEFKGEELRVGRSPIIDSAQFIRAVADNMKERLISTTANRAQASVAANRKEGYNSLINQMSSTLTTGTMTILDLEIMR